MMETIRPDDQWHCLAIQPTSQLRNEPYFVGNAILVRYCRRDNKRYVEQQLDVVALRYLNRGPRIERERYCGIVCLLLFVERRAMLRNYTTVLIAVMNPEVPKKRKKIERAREREK